MKLIKTMAEPGAMELTIEDIQPAEWEEDLSSITPQPLYSTVVVVQSRLCVS